MNTRGHLSSETIDLLLLSALSGNEANDAKAHIDGCASCKTRWLELNEDKQRFEQFVFPRTLAKVEARASAERGSLFDRLKLKFAIPALIAVTAAVAILVPNSATNVTPETEDEAYVGVKGPPSFEMVAQRGDSGAFPVTASTELQPNDRIRFIVNPNGAKYLLVASTDGAGVFSVYHPFGAGTSLPLADALKKQELPGAVELDSTLGGEKVIAVFSNEPVTSAQVEAALKLDAKNPKLPGVSFVTRTFRKVEP